MKRFLLFAAIITAFIGKSFAQNVFDANDPVTRYSSSAPYGSAQRPDTNQVGLQKWVANSTNGVSSGSGSFNNSSFKPYFINYFNTRMSFRLKYPKNFNSPENANRKYPVMIFMHGAGEVGCESNGGFYNNEKQLVHGGKLFLDRVDNNQFDGFLLYPQIRSTDPGCWGEWGGLPSAKFNTVMGILDSLVKYVRVDNDRVFINGLSGGAVAAWRMAEGYPTRVAKIAPVSGAGLLMNYPAFVHIPIWLATGGKDTNPSPSMAAYSELKVTEIGGSLRRSLYADLGHSSWYRHWQEPDYVAFMNDVHKANPLIFYNRFEFCPDSGVNARLGITAGFYEYEWQRDGVLIASRTGTINTIHRPEYIISYTGNEVTVKDYGTYSVRFRRVNNGPWSEWSMKPAVIKPKSTTQTPPIEVVGMRSKVLPSLDGKTTALLQLPAGFTNYQWVRTTDNVLVSSAQVFEAPVGTYKARYSETFGCGTLYSPVFKVVNASGTPKPDAAKNLSVTTISQTTLRLDWNDNPNAGTNESGFEIYRATKAGGPYTLIYITAPNVVTFSDTTLIPSSTYYYVVRAVSETGAAATSNESNGKTDVDNVLPAAPSALEYRGSTSTTVSLRWKAASDNAGIARYDIYANGMKMYSTTGLSFTVGNLDSLTSYTFYVKAVDKAGNVSVNSNQVIGYTHRQGLNYKYYNGSFSNLPNFNTLTPVKTGVMDTVNTGPGIRTQDDNFAFLWDGRIYIPVTATYTFETNSDDGSRLYVDVPYSSGATALVNNDGAHGAQIRTGSKYLTQGYHTFVVSYAEVTGDHVMELFWSNNAGLARESLPKNFLSLDDFPATAQLNAPGSLAANALSYNKIQLSWTDNSSDESGFEIVRSTSLNGTYVPVVTTAANVNSYTDSALSPATNYYYKIRAVSQHGESPFVTAISEGNWKLNNNYNEENGGSALSPSGTSMSSSQQAEGSHSAEFSSGDYIGFNGGSSAFPSAGGYSQRTVALWIRPSSTNSRRIVFEFGGNDNGMGLRFNSDDLVGGIASNSSRNTVTLSNFTNNGNWLSNQWNHVALVYNNSSLTLYLNGVQVASTNSLSFASVGNSNNTSRLGNPSGSSSSNTVFNDNNYSGYQGYMDNLIIIRGALSPEEINQLRNNTYKSSSARTLDAPAAPSAPNGLTANVLSTNSVYLSWNDNSNVETGFEIWRSSGDKSNNRMIAKIAGGSGAQKTYTDSALFANVTYYYKVRATGEVSPSSYTAEVSAKTLNTKPVIKKVVNFTMKYGTSYTLPVSAIDKDGDVLTFTTINLPTFATIQQVSNGNMNIVYNPPVTRRGSFPMSVIVSDGNNGADTTFFNVTVNTNDVPVLSAVSDVNLLEGKEASITFTATDNNGTAGMLWSFEGLPSFATFSKVGGTGTIIFKPDYSASGEYAISIIVNDGFGAWTSREMKLTVADKEPQETMQFNFRTASAPVLLWNSVNITPPTFWHGAVTDTKTNVQNVTLSLVKGTITGSVQGPQTGNNSGAYPDLIMKDIMTWGFSMGTNRNDTVIIKVAGLDVAKKYEFAFFGGYNLNGDANSVSRYKIGNEIATINYYQNRSRTDTIADVVPDAAGEVLITMIGDPHNNRGGVLNALVIRSSYDDGSTPAKPLQLTGTHFQNTSVELKWQDRAFNEIGYHVYRSMNRTSGYVLLNEGAASKDSTTFADPNVAPETTYYYYVAGYNGAGIGSSSDTIKIVTGNNKPVIAVANEIYVKSGVTTNIDFPVTDDAGDIVNVTIENNASFIQLVNIGGSNYRLSLSPLTDHIGWSTATLKATDQKGAVAVKTIYIGVNDKHTKSVFVKFGTAGKNAPAPWNNFLGVRTANSVMSNLVDESNTPTTYSITMVNSWSGVTDLGHMTGLNNGIYPDSVLQSGISDGTGPKTIKFSGLDNNKRYNVVIVGSHNEGTSASVEYTSGTTKDTLNARYNMHQSANLNGLVPVNGEISFSTLRVAGGITSVINAIVLEEYEPSSDVLNPYHVYAEAADRTTIDVSWNDRSSDEDALHGFTLERATDSLFTQNTSSISLPGNTTNYRDAGLNPNTRYWYRVRARAGGDVYSDYSNRAKAVTPASTVYMNFNYTLPDADFPWNNTFTSPSLETTFENLTNHAGAVSGMSMSITKIFNGEFTAGVNTGDNSGVVPDKALASNYWIDNTQESQIKVSGLNHSRRYRVGFFGSSSSAGWFKGNYTATYTVNGKTVYLNSWMNSTKVVYIDDLVPDENGELLLNFSTTEAAAYGFNGGVIIEDYSVPEEVAAIISSSSLVEPATVTASREESMSERAMQTNAVRVYPNPFYDFLNMDFNNVSENDNVSVEVYDLSGRISFRRMLGKLPKGANTIRLSSADANLNTGIYIVTLSVNGKTVLANKVIKLNDR